MKAELYGAAWDGRPISTGKADALIKQAERTAVGRRRLLA